MKFTAPGPAVPYLRMTQAQVRLLHIPDHRISGDGLKLKRRIQRYLNYKEYVNVHAVKVEYDRVPKTKVYLNVFIYFQNRKHGDPENIRKGIQDALFNDDRMVAGSVDFDYDADNPRAEIEIIEGDE